MAVKLRAWADISIAHPTSIPNPYLEYAPEALAILERIGALTHAPAITTPTPAGQKQ